VIVGAASGGAAVAFVAKRLRANGRKGETKMEGTATATAKVVSREQWLEARKALLGKEKEFTRRRDELARLRCELPWVKVEKSYLFDSPDGKKSLADLFRRQEPAPRLPLHVRAGLGAGLPELLVPGRSLRRRELAPPPRPLRGLAPGRSPGRSFARRCIE